MICLIRDLSTMSTGSQSLITGRKTSFTTCKFTTKAIDQTQRISAVGDPPPQVAGRHLFFDAADPVSPIRGTSGRSRLRNTPERPAVESTGPSVPQPRHEDRPLTRIASSGPCGTDSSPQGFADHQRASPTPTSFIRHLTIRVGLRPTTQSRRVPP